MKTYRRRETVTAIRFDGESTTATEIIIALCERMASAVYHEDQNSLSVNVPTNGSPFVDRYTVAPGDYVVMAEGGTVHVLGRDDFDQMFEPVPTTAIQRMSYANLRLIEDAYETGDGCSLTLEARDDGCVKGTFEGALVYEGLEVDGLLYSIAAASPGKVSVLIGNELVGGVVGKMFESRSEAKAYIAGLTAR